MSPRVQLHRVCLAQIRAGKRAWVEALRDKAMARIAAGGGQISAMSTAAANGKSFGRDIRLDAVEVADIAQAALDEEDEVGGSATGVTTPDFSA